MPRSDADQATGQLVLVSGGLDSVTALYAAYAQGAPTTAVSFDYGARHGDRELPCAAWHATHLGVRHLVIPLEAAFAAMHSALLTHSGGAIPDGHYEEASMKQTVVPFRNGVMIAVAAGLAESLGARRVVIAAHAGDHAIYPDCREAFMDAMGRAVELGTYAGIVLHRPFIAMDKAQIVQRGAELGVDYARTWSCYKGGTLHCGTCGTCVERREAFLRAGVPDPTPYAATPPLPPAPGPTVQAAGS
jgi:7-cyano-7-deazaguanine synthase